MIKLGTTIKKIRAEKGLSQKALAEDADVTPSFLSLIENNRRDPSMAMIRRIASALDVPEEVLIWDAVKLPPNLTDDDLRMCEIAKLLVRRYYETAEATEAGKESQ